jgi:hypothetical protein
MKRIFAAVLTLATVWLLGPALAHAAPPAPEGKAVYVDNFDDKGARSGLESNLKGDETFSRGFHGPGGVYQMELRQTNDTRAVFFPDQTYGQVSVKIEIWDYSDAKTGDVSHGVVFRAQDPTHYYAALVDSRKQQFAIRKLDGTTWSDLVAWKPAAVIKQKDEHNFLRVDASGNTFTAYVNDEMVGTVQDSAYPKGQIGFIVSNVDAPKPHYHFDNIEVYSTEPGPKLTTGTGSPSTLPTSGVPATGTSLALLILALALSGLGLGVRTPRSAAPRVE